MALNGFLPIFRVWSADGKRSSTWFHTDEWFLMTEPSSLPPCFFPPQKKLFAFQVYGEWLMFFDGFIYTNCTGARLCTCHQSCDRKQKVAIKEGSWPSRRFCTHQPSREAFDPTLTSRLSRIFFSSSNLTSRIAIGEEKRFPKWFSEASASPQLFAQTTFQPIFLQPSLHGAFDS